MHLFFSVPWSSKNTQEDRYEGSGYLVGGSNIS
jgi:hypothetical protein